jgi:hypothetical protein
MTFGWADVILAKDVGEYIVLAGATSPAGSSKGLLTRYGRYKRSLPVNPSNNSLSDLPHARLAGASGTDELLRFIENFGPVVAYDFDKPETTSEVNFVGFTGIGAKQRWDELKREQKLFRSLLQLIQAVKTGDTQALAKSTPLFNDIVDGTYAWIEQHDRESLERESNELPPISWNWSGREQDILENYFHSALGALNTDPKCDRLTTLLVFGDPIELINGAICQVINAFPTSVQYLTPKKGVGKTKELPRAVEMPRSDLTFGIRPVLYFMIRTDYLQGWELRLCGRIGCGTWFRPTEKRPHHCSSKCAQLERQTKYWHSKGSSQRRSRVQKQSRTAKSFDTRKKGQGKAGD